MQIDWTATGTIALAIVTVVLAGATIWLAVTTRDMAKVSRDAFLLECRPFCIFQNFIFKFYIEKKAPPSTEPDRNFLKIGFIFRNSGKVPVKYRVESLHVTFAGRTVDNASFNNRGGSIPPGDTTVYWHPPIPGIDLTNSRLRELQSSRLVFGRWTQLELTAASERFSTS